MKQSLPDPDPLPPGGPADPPAPVQALPLPQRWKVSRVAAGLALLLALSAAGLAYGLSHLFGHWGEAAAPLAAAAAVALLVLPLSLLILKLARQLERAQRLLERFDMFDRPGGAPSGGPFKLLLEREWARARRYGQGMGVVLIEVDRFRRLCEVRGEAAGDTVLRELSRAISRGLRGGDALARYDHAQLIVFLAAADTTGALDVAERIREVAEQLEVPWNEQRLRISACCGVATLRPAHTQLGSLLHDAQAALAVARHAGGNCVRAAPVDVLPEPLSGAPGKV
jgi:diguanylate cyclase